MTTLTAPSPKMVKPNSEEARDAVNVFVSVDVLGLLDAKGYPGTRGTIEDAIKEHYQRLLTNNPQVGALLPIAMGQGLQVWDSDTCKYKFNPLWNLIISQGKNNPMRFASTSGTKNILNDYVRLIAGHGDTQGWKIKIDESDIVTSGGVKYLTSAYNLSIKAKNSQWIRWWGNSITPFSSIQCIIKSITNENRPQDLRQLDHQQNSTVSYTYPSGESLGSSQYTIATQLAFSRLGQLSSEPKVGTKIQYDILFNMVDNEGDIFASFQVDPEIIVE